MPKLEDLCKKESSSIAQKDLEGKDGSYPIYGASGFIKNIDFYQQERPYIAVVKDGAGVGRVMCLPAKSSVIGTMQYIIPEDGVVVNYLAYALEHMNLAKYYTGATIPHIYFKDYCKEELPAHTKEEQRHISTSLDKVSELIALRKEQLVKLDQLVKSRFVDLFGDEQRFLAKACNQVSDVCESKVGIVIQPTQYYTEDTNNSVKAFRSLNVKPFRVNDADWVHFTVESNNLMQRTQVHTNDVAVVRSGVNLGDSCVVPAEFDGCNAIDILILTPKSCILPVYLSAFINYPCGKNQIINAQRGGALKHLNNKQLQDAQIYLPPIKLQKQFADFVEQTEKTKLTIQSSLDKLEVLKKSLMQEYFG